MNGVPYDTALSMGPAQRYASAIIFQEFNGREFDTDRMDWKDPA